MPSDCSRTESDHRQPSRRRIHAHARVFQTLPGEHHVPIYEVNIASAAVRGTTREPSNVSIVPLRSQERPGWFWPTEWALKPWIEGILMKRCTRSIMLVVFCDLTGPRNRILDRNFKQL